MIIIEINDVYRYSEFKRRFSWMKILLGKKRGGVMRKRGGGGGCSSQRGMHEIKS